MKSNFKLALSVILAICLFFSVYACYSDSNDETNSNNSSIPQDGLNEDENKKNSEFQIGFKEYISGSSEPLPLYRFGIKADSNEFDIRDVSMEYSIGMTRKTFGEYDNDLYNIEIGFKHADINKTMVYKTYTDTLRSEKYSYRTEMTDIVYWNDRIIEYTLEFYFSHSLSVTLPEDFFVGGKGHIIIYSRYNRSNTNETTVEKHVHIYYKTFANKVLLSEKYWEFD